jgi:hypothetical protein
MTMQIDANLTPLPSDQPAMTRRQILTRLLTLAALPLAAHPAMADDTPHTPFVTWVERFYRAQLAARATREGRATPENQQGAEPTLSFPLQDYLTTEMRALFDAAQGKPLPADTPEGPILDYVFGWGALPNREIKLESVRAAPWWHGLFTDNLALVTITINGNERELTLKGHYDAPTFNWQIADIDYGDGAGEALSERLERLAG